MVWPRKAPAWATRLWDGLCSNHVWQHMIKHTIAVTIAFTIAVIPPVNKLFGSTAYLLPMTTVFGHSGQRLGQMVQSLAFILGGTVLGLAWSLLGLHLSSLAFDANPPVANAVKAVFVLAGVVFHGYVRSHSPRVFTFVYLFIIVIFTTLVSTQHAVTAKAVSSIFYPILAAFGVLLLVNVTVFPEFSSGFLGNTTIATLCQAESTLRSAIEWFIESSVPAVRGPPHSPRSAAASHADGDCSGTEKLAGEEERSGAAAQDPRRTRVTRLAALTAAKAKLRTALSGCKNAYDECTFEVVWSVLPPGKLKPISDTAMRNLVRNVITLIGACESKFALIGEDDDAEEAQHAHQQPDGAGGEEARAAWMVDTTSEEEKRTGRGRKLDEASTSRSSSGSQRDDSSSDGSTSSGEDDREEDWKNRDEHGANIHKKWGRKRQKAAPEVQSLAPEDMVQWAKPKRAIASGDVALLELLLRRVRAPVTQLQQHLMSAIEMVTICLAYCYDVKRLPDKAAVPKGVLLEEIDIRIEIFEKALVSYDKSSMKALGQAASMEEQETNLVDIMPRAETFLISSVLLSFRDAASQVLLMMKHARSLVEKRQARHDKKRFYLPRKAGWRKWLTSAGEQDAMTLPQNARKEAREGKGNVQDRDKDDDDGGDSDADPGRALLRTETQKGERKADEEAALGAKGPVKAAVPGPPPPLLAKSNRAPKKQEKQRRQQQQTNPTTKTQLCCGDGPSSPPLPPPPTLLQRCRQRAADGVEWVLENEHLGYALKMAVAIFLVTWPAFDARLSSWYNTSRAGWAPLQLVLVFEVAIGSSLWVFVARAFGTGFGCAWGYVSWKAASGYLPALVVMVAVGIIPATYVQFATPYVKAGMIAIISICVVALADLSEGGPGWDLFLKRFAAFMAGGTVAMIVEMTIYPVKARDRMVESLSSCVAQISHMQAALASGIDHPKRPVRASAARPAARFGRAKDKAQAALSAAEMFLPFCSSELRLKGSFRSLAPIYSEIVYVLHQIIDRMHNMVCLRQAYGSTMLEDLNPLIYHHRRNVAGSIMVALFVVNEALTTKLPMPQFLPSSRLAHVRLIHRVREILHSGATGTPLSALGKTRRASTTAASSEMMVAMTALDGAEGGGAPTGGMTPTSLGGASSVMTLLALDEATIRRATRPEVLSWNAAAAGQMETIEYLEELVDLTKLLVGVNAFRSGMLERPSYRGYVRRFKERESAILAAQRERAASHAAGMGMMMGDRKVSQANITGQRRATVADGAADLESAAIPRNGSSSSSETAVSVAPAPARPPRRISLVAISESAAGILGGRRGAMVAGGAALEAGAMAGSRARRPSRSLGVGRGGPGAGGGAATAGGQVGGPSGLGVFDGGGGTAAAESPGTQPWPSTPSRTPRTPRTPYTPRSAAAWQVDDNNLEAEEMLPLSLQRIGTRIRQARSVEAERLRRTLSGEREDGRSTGVGGANGGG